MLTGQVEFKQSGNYQPTVLRGRPIGAKVSSVDTLIHQLVKSGTNTGTRSTTTFELTGIDTTNNVDYAEWILEIPDEGNRQVARIINNTFANPGVVTIARTFELEFPPSGNLNYILYPDVLNPIGIHFDPDAIGTLTIYRASIADTENEIAQLRGGDVYMANVYDMRTLYYQFSVGTGSPEIFRWSE